MGFFDDLSKKASETYKNTAQKTNKITREMRLKSMMNDYKGAIEKVYAEIGKKVYEKHIREENIDIKSELAEECSKIDAYAKEIEDMRMEMLALKDLRLCKVCAAEIPLTAKFCSKCGAMQQQEEKTAQSQNVAPVEIIENNVQNNNEENVSEIVSENASESEVQAIPETTSTPQQDSTAQIIFEPTQQPQQDNNNIQ